MLTDCSFPRSRRLLLALDFQKVFKKTRCRSVDKYLCLLAVKNDYTCSRLGLAIAKKKIKTSVARQRIKRLIRESFRQNHYRLKQNGLKQNSLNQTRSEHSGFDIVVMANPAAAQATNQKIALSLQQHWKKIIDQCNR